LGNQADDAHFAFAEAPDRFARKGAGSGTAAEALDQLASDGWGKHGFAGRHGAHGSDQLITAGVLEEETARAGLEGVVDVLVQIEGGQHQDPRAGATLDEPGGCFDAVHLGHADVHQDDVRVQ
jgi:hypothetical protein